MKRALWPAAIIAACLLAPAAASAQLALGQYEDEAPLGTWNILGPLSAPSLGLGTAAFARAWDGSASLVNPALLATLPRLTASVSGSYAAAAMFRFSLVNTGVVSSTGNPAAGVLGADGGALAVRRGDWAFAVVVSAPESYARPAVDVGEGGYELTFEQDGYLRVWHAGIARRLPAGLTAGLGMNYAAGRLDRTVIERYADGARVVTITDDKSERPAGFFLNGGLAWESAGGLTAALAVRTPYVRKGPAQSHLRYEVPSAGTDIRIDAEATNAYRQPWMVGAGLALRLSEAWSLAADAAYFGWARYRVTVFDEPLARPFRNIVRAGAGVEYLAPARMYGSAARIPFRLGFLVDPQPVTSVRSTYFALTFGTGLELKALAVGVSACLGQERGSGRSLKSGRIAVSVRYVVPH